MKKLTVLLLFVGMTSLAQVKGNKNIVTQSFDVTTIEEIKINLYAKVTIDQSAKESLTITADENLIKLIDKGITDGTLHLDQKEWISPSQNIIITIGAPNLKRLETGTHDDTKVINLNNEYLKVLAPIGNVYLEGKTKELRIAAELATVDASKLSAEKAFVNLWKWGKVKVNPISSLWADVSNDGKLIYINKPSKYNVKTKKGGKVFSLSESENIKNPEAKFIKFKIRNNSKNRNQFYVVGPKPDGSKFSYGFPMMPNATRKENWSIGTKVYKVNTLGFKKLLIEITADDEDKIVSLFE
ncbi:MAG: DUF2807 domain-containing protein [Winogradskyella sp.]|uniref:GIN domain-containing protein n=1 Tax=Winogradskyella sp. TaxID=1883156 RepID=UPI0025F51894|nr:DUF2807 domain-containing protein [Winogradskyella sp.]NRB60371.1 DUF2807 domain-containing protein [Winogradskyella sp.]